MTALTIRLPESLHKEIKELARAEGVSINQFLTLAAAEKISALRTIDYLREEASKGSRVDFEAFLTAVPAAEPEEDDRLEKVA
ncbi:MAG TPA: toxin-antitoxin system HicB family antitoxin [Chloroflexota bacterium]|nr:toxin-antitoxin system HicB family antitoxin [Chloroflexota bacterium]